MTKILTFPLAGLIPVDAHRRQQAMQSAAKAGVSNRFVQSRFVASVYVIQALAISTLDTVGYLGVGIFYFTANVVKLNKQEAVAAGLHGLDGSVRSFLFVAVGVAYLAFGFFFPHSVFGSVNPPKGNEPQTTALITLPRRLPKQQSQVLSNSQRIAIKLLFLRLGSHHQIVIDPRQVPRRFLCALPATPIQSPQIPPVFAQSFAQPQGLVLYVPTFAFSSPKRTPRLVLRLGAHDQIIIDPERVTSNQINQLFEELLPARQGSFVEISPRAKRVLPRGNMVNYVTRFSPLYLQTYQALVQKGQHLVQRFERGAENEISKSERRTWMAPFIWHLMNRAETEQGKGFKEGMFKVEDPGYRMHDFFASVSTKRGSSHFQNTRLNSLGMDIPQDGCTGLPAGHQTVHFGKLTTLDPTKKYTFFKPESWGTESILQKIGHLGSYLMTRPAHLLGYATQAGQYKEHTPPALKKEFFKLCNEISLKDFNRALVKDFGISGMYKILSDYLKLYPHSPFKKNVSEMIEKLSPNSFGMEVILNGQLR